jgi:predicted ribosomally synthesized peptide with nif11-like leader
MADVKKFVHRVMNDPELRMKLNKAESREERDAILQEAGFSFTAEEFDEGVRAIDVTLQSTDDATKLNDVKIWWDMLNQSPD